MIDRQSALQSACILLLEDDALISLDTEDTLLSLGAARVLVAHTIAEAEDLVARETIDAAVLDLVIGRNKSDAFAGRLVDRRIPVVFASGLGEAASLQLPEALRKIPTVGKPYTANTLYSALAAALGRPE